MSWLKDLLERLFGGVEEPQEETKEDYYNNKYPEYPITYNGRTLANTNEMIAIDVRNFITPYDYELESLRTEFVQYMEDDKNAVECLKWVIDNITYTSDKSQFGIPEEWLFAYETLKTRKGDCDDGAILLANLMVVSGIPYWKVRLTAGNTSAGGHCYVTYYDEEGDRWVVLDWCYWPNKKEVKARKEYKKDKRYGQVWFSWNKKYSFYKAENDPSSI